jgi:hypothetical protein
VILGSDTFNRVEGTLGAGWNELSGGAFGASNFSTDGSVANIDSSPVVHGATLIGTTQSDQFFQCWMQTPAANNVGLIFRVLDTSNFYFMQATASVVYRLFRCNAGVFTVMATSAGSITVPTSAWFRIGVRLIGQRIQVYLNNSYNDNPVGNEGPIIDFTVTTGALVGTGPCGICTNVNTAAGISGAASPIRWNDFISFDGGADTIYVDLDFNGGVAGEGMGTVDRPDLGIRYGLNNAGLNKGGKLKLTDALYTDLSGINSNFIGHAGKFSGAFTFPTYDPENGSMVGLGSAGSPNLTIEGMDGARTALRETANTQFFVLRETATGIVYRSLDFELTDSSSAASAIGGFSPTNDHSQQYAKCLFDFQDPTGNNQGVTLNGSGTDRFEMFFCYGRCEPATLEHNYYLSFINRVKQIHCRFNVLKGLVSPLGEISSAVNFGTGTDLQPTDVADFDHFTFLDIVRGSFNDAAISILDPVGMLGTFDIKNSIVTGPAGGVPDETEYGWYTSGGSPDGSIVAHHNGYADVTTPRDGAVTDGGAEHVGSPDYTDPFAPFTWQHTAGQGLGGEGTSAAIVLEGDWRPRSVDYVHMADDSTPGLGILDRGAIQGYIPAVQGGGGGGSLPIPGPGDEDGGRLIPGPCPPDYCLEVTYDPAGERGGPIVLTDELMEMRPLRDSKDYLLRDYRAEDTDLVWNDPQGVLDPRVPGSVLANANYTKARVEIRVIDNVVGVIGHVYVGELLTVAAEVGKTTWRLGNLFKRLLDKPLLANTTGRQVTTNGNTFGSGMGSGNYINGLTVNPGCRIEVWTFTFLNDNQFTCEGSLTGQDGAGSRSAEFISDSGSITVRPFRWTGTFGAGSTTSISTPWGIRFQTIVDILLALLQQDSGAGLTPEEIDLEAFEALRSSPLNQQLEFVQDSEQSVLKTLAELSRHISATVLPLPDGRITIFNFIPELMDRSTLEALCHWDDLIDLKTEETPIYNEFTFKFDYDWDDTQNFLQTLSWPKRDDENPSLQEFQVRYPAPTVELRGFTAVQDTVVEQIAQQLYNRFSRPNELMTILLKGKRWQLPMDELLFLQSIIPIREVFVEPVELRKTFAPGAPFVEIDAINTENFVQAPTACGFGFYVDEHFADDCWVYF